MPFRPHALLTVAAVVAGLFVGGCGFGRDESREDADDATSSHIDKSAPQVIAFNNKYSNVETKCDGHGHRIFVTTSKTVLVLPDPTCKGYVKGQEPAIVVDGAAR